MITPKLANGLDSLLLPPDCPTYKEFIEWRASHLAQHQVDASLRFDELNVYAALAGLRAPYPDEELLSRAYHRCHLAEAWLAWSGFEGKFTRRQALVSRGVRDSLLTVFGCLAKVANKVRESETEQIPIQTKATEQGIRFSIPDDVYPVYAELALQAGLTVETHHAQAYFAGATSGELGGISAILPWDEAVTHALVCLPVKPWGISPAPEFFARVREWLAGDANRRLIVDAVYDLEPGFDPMTRELTSTGQVILLHSLSKGWLQPQVFGVALVPEADLTMYESAFRFIEVSRNNLAIADLWLRKHGGRPTLVNDAVRELWKRRLATLWRLLDQEAVSNIENAGGYTTVVSMPYADILKNHGILGVPMSVYGGNADLTVLSCLPVAEQR